MASDPWWAEILKAVPSVVTAITAVVGVRIASSGLNKWREESAGKRKAELAEQALTDFYEARDVFTWVRSRGAFGGEGESREAASHESDELKKRRDTYFRSLERLRQEKELFARINAQRYTFAARFGRDSIKPFEQIMGVHNQIMTTASVLIETAMEHETQQMREQLESMFDVLWSPFKRPDKIVERIDEAIHQIEQLCIPILDAKSETTRLPWQWWRLR